MLVQKLRLKRGWSQQQLAELSGLSVRTVQRIERGQDVSVESLKSLAAVFEIDFVSLQPGSNMSISPDQGVSTEEALAFRQVEKIRKFYLHLVKYVVVVGVLVAINLLTDPNNLWVIWVAIAWAAGLLVCAVSVFNLLPFLGPEWEKKQIEKRLGRPL